jgi:hypothetical protein
MVVIPKGLKTYSGDGRLPTEELYRAFLKLAKKFGWVVEKIYEQKWLGISLPILGLRTPKEGTAIWLVAGIHGEEPAGLNALAKEIEFLGRLGEKIPLVLLPLCNPLGYLRNWTNPTEYRDEERKGASVGDSRHFLPDFKNPKEPRLEKPICPEAEAITFWVVETAKRSKPRLVIDFHEDEDKSLKDPYIFFNREMGADDPVVREVVKILLKSGFSLQMRGTTRTGERIVGGVVSNIADSSLDELLSAKKIIFKGRLVSGPSASKVVVVETRIIGIPLLKRVKAHQAILYSLKKFWSQP